MDESLCMLKEEVDQLFGKKAKLGSPEGEEQIVICRHCGAVVKLIGLPPALEPGEPYVMLYYPIQYCPQCGVEIGRALDIELIAMAPWFMPGAARWHDITCSRCGSELRYKTQALPPQYLRSLQCPICKNDLGVEGLEVDIISAQPWPPPTIPAEEVKEEVPWKPIIIVGGAFAILSIGAGIGYFINSRKSKKREEPAILRVKPKYIDSRR